MHAKWSFAGIILIVTSSAVQAEDMSGGFVHEGYDRSYILHTPPQYNETDSLPLVIALHGGGKNAEWIRDASNLSTKADDAAFFVCYPNGIRTGADGQNNWNAGPMFNMSVDDVSFISALIDTLRANYRIDTLRVYVTGLSAGAMMTNRLACELADRIAAVAPVAGPLVTDWKVCKPSRLLSIIYFQARNDIAMPYYGAYWVSSADSLMHGWAERLGCNIGPDTFYNDSAALRQTWKRADDSCEVVFWTTEDGGHSWPGGYPYEPWADIPSDDISANDLMWEFFKAHPIPLEEPEPGIKESPASVLDPSNPSIFTNSAVIRFLVERSEYVSLKLYDVQGRKIAVLLEQRLDAGSHEVAIDAAGLPRGAYFYELKTPTAAISKPIILIK